MAGDTATTALSLISKVSLQSATSRISFRFQANSRYWLHFRGINYSAEVYLNGKQVLLEQPRGMFLRRALDVTAIAEKQTDNRLAVLVHPPDHPGCVDVPGQGADHQVRINSFPTFEYF